MPTHNGPVVKAAVIGAETPERCECAVTVSVYVSASGPQMGEVQGIRESADTWSGDHVADPSGAVDMLLSTLAAEALARKSSAIPGDSHGDWWDWQATPLDELKLMLRMHMEQQDMASVMLTAARILLRRAAERCGQPNLLVDIGRRGSVNSADVYRLNLQVKALVGCEDEDQRRIVLTNAAESKRAAREDKVVRLSEAGGNDGGAGPTEAPAMATQGDPVHELENEGTDLTFGEWSEAWLDGQRPPVMRTSTFVVLSSTVKGHLVPYFGETPLSSITSADIVAFREQLQCLDGRRGERLSAKRVNDVVRTLGKVLADFSKVCGFEPPAVPRRLPRNRIAEILPFTEQEAEDLIAAADGVWRNYLIVRMYTGLHAGEVDGLKWKYVSLEDRLISVRETVTSGRTDRVKEDSTERDVEISEEVYRALVEQQALTARRSQYVFCNRQGQPVDSSNFAKRVWRPLLEEMKLEIRPPNSMRHTAAVLWLKSGKPKDWVAKQLGYIDSSRIPRAYSGIVGA